jgi:hypothetical protein
VSAGPDLAGDWSADRLMHTRHAHADACSHTPVLCSNMQL